MPEDPDIVKRVLSGDVDSFRILNGAQVTFIKDAKSEVTAIIRHKPGLPDSEGKKIKVE